MHQEAAFQALVTKKAQERVAVLEAQYANLHREATSEFTLINERVTVAERDLELERRKVRELHETHKANAKAYNKLKAQCDKASQRNNLNNAFAAPQPPPQQQQQRQPPLTPQSSHFRTSINPSPSSSIRGGPATKFSDQNTWNTSFVGSQPLMNNPHQSTTRPRRSLRDQNVDPSLIVGPPYSDAGGSNFGEARGGGEGGGIRYERAGGGGITAMPFESRRGGQGGVRSSVRGGGGSGGGEFASSRMKAGASKGGFRPALFGK